MEKHDQERQYMKDHDLLIRIDERLEHFVDVELPELKSHLGKINGRLGEVKEDTIICKTRWRWAKPLIIIGGGGGAAGGVGTLIKHLLGG